MKRILSLTLLALLLVGCAGFNRGCSAWNAQNFGSDWLVVQYKMDGQPMNCWVLKGESVSNEHSSDGIYWKDTTTGHLVHISGWYNRVQLDGSTGLAEAAKLVGVDASKCGNGVYPKLS